MKNCHECDSEVADNDIFCPFCGISIQGVAVDAASDGDAFSSTIVIPSSVPVPEFAAASATREEPDASETSAPPADKIDGGYVLAAKVNVVDQSLESALPINELDGASGVLDTEASIDVDTLPHDEPGEAPPGIPSESNEAPADDKTGEVVEEQVLAERFTGAIASNPAGIGHLTAAESAEADAEPREDALPAADDQEFQSDLDSINGPPAEADHSPGIQSESSILERVSEVSAAEAEHRHNPEQEPTVETIDVSLSDVPTPFLLSTDDLESTVENIDETVISTGEGDVERSGEPSGDQFIERDSIKPADIDPVGEPVYDEESSPEAEMFRAPEVDSQTVDPIDESETPGFLMAEADQVLPPLDGDFAETTEPESDVSDTGEPMGPTSVGSSTDVGDVEASAQVIGEPIEPLVADTGDGLGNAETNGGTTPNIGTTGTDGRKSGLKPLAEGTVLNNRYDIVRKIGGGGMGAVYLASDRNLGGVQRAVKEMVQSHIEEEQQEKAVEDFKRESTILSTLDHPSIPTIYDYFFDAQEGRFYLVMKYISGGDLAGRLRATPEGRIDERTVCEWALQIIDVLDYLHNLPTKIVYRDLKPSNVMIDGNSGRIMLIDFGIARSINQNQEKGVTAVGTMGYAPPELFSGNVEPRSDIYSLGSTMFHLLTGADPQNNPLLIFDFQKNPRPRQINPQLSDQIERILMRSVEYNADARFESAAEMKQALAAHIDSLKTGQITYGVTEVPQSVSLSHQIVFCGFCGQRIVATDMFCAFCGSKQPLAQHGVHAEVYSRSVGTARLVIEGTSDLAAPAYGLEKNENLVGRRDPMSNIFPEVDLSKYDPQTKISRRHAKIWRDGSNYLVEDLGSSNGTLLLTQVSDTMRLLPHQPHPLANGDRIRIGDTTLQFIVG